MRSSKSDTQGKKKSPQNARQQPDDAAKRGSSSSPTLGPSKVTKNTESKSSSSSSQSIGAWDTGDAISHAPPLGPPDHSFYPASRTVWSYEVTTGSEIYRISTVPIDFLGNSHENWPRALAAAHADYKAVEVALESAKNDLKKSRSANDDIAAYVDLQERVYRATYNAAKAREAFQKMWPSAFGWTDNLNGHIVWHRNLERGARKAQSEALKRLHEQNNQTLEMMSRWLHESVDEWSIRPIYAMSPNQYEELYNVVTERKNRLRKLHADGNWEIVVSPPKTMTLPQLPPPRTDLPMPEYSEHERVILQLPDRYRLPDNLFQPLLRDTYEGN